MSPLAEVASSTSRNLDISLHRRITRAHVSMPFSHQPLANPSESIRLFRFLPQKRLPGLRCIIEHYAMSTAKQLGYSAISYTWQPTNPRQTIKLNGSTCQIGHNLWMFLNQLAATAEPGLLWADSMCINQSDIAEKNAQVALMGSIYANALKVLLWLGEAADDSNVVMDLANKPEDPRSDDWYLSHESMERWRALAALCDRPYWTRVWIIQEVCSAPEHVVSVHCGSQKTAFQGLQDMWRLALDQWYDGANHLTDPDFDEDYNGYGVRVIESPLGSLDTKIGEHNLIFLLMQHRSAQCSDLKDKVYALLALGSDTSGPHCVLKADYSKDVWEVILDVMSFYKVKEELGALDLLEDISPASSSDEFKEWLRSAGVELTPQAIQPKCWLQADGDADDDPPAIAVSKRHMMKRLAASRKS